MLGAIVGRMSVVLSDLFGLVNGPWLGSHVIPDDRGVDGTFYALRDRAEEDVRLLVESDGASRAGRLFGAFMDVGGVERAGLGVIDEDLRGFSSVDELVGVLGWLDRVGVGSPLGCFVAKDAGAEEAVAWLMQSGLSLPDEAYYRDPAHAELLVEYERHVGRMLGLLSLPEGVSAEVMAGDVVKLETDIAAGHWDVVESRDAVRTYNPRELGQLPERVQALLRAAGLPDFRVNVMMPSFVEHLESLLVEERLDQWRAWVYWHVLHARAGVLAPEVSKADFEFFGQKLSGATQQKDRWKRGLQLVEGLVGEELGQLFVAEHFPASSKDEMVALVNYLIAAYRERIGQLEWMTPITRQRALEKLDKFQAKIGYPDQWRSFEGLEFSSRGEDLVANVRAGASFNHDYQLSKIGKPADRSEWVTTPQTVNAFYNPVVNDITFPAAILRPPFYSPEDDAAEKFGAIGAVIGHEIGHGFDDQGSQYDGDGNLNSWWTDEDREAFNDLTAKLVEQFNGLVPSVLEEAGIETTGVNGRFTLGENIGDLGGLGIAVVAYRKYLEEQGLSFDTAPKLLFDVRDGDPSIEGKEFTGLQRLFMAWARVWRSKIRAELAQQYLAVDPHSPAEFRCNVIAGNIAELYEAFDVEEGSKVWIAPEQRVRIW